MLYRRRSETHKYIFHLYIKTRDIYITNKQKTCDTYLSSMWQKILTYLKIHGINNFHQ